ncbi:MAG: hypothetical protein IJN34_05155 [Clostridia bacterium]|nr:hypothetical protein [Clostridia bacterium]
MKKKSVIICVILTCLVVLCSVTIASAVNSKLKLVSDSDQNKICEELYTCIVPSDVSLSKATESALIEHANSHVATYYAEKDALIEKDDPITISCYYDNTILQEFYEIQQEEYTISLAKDYSLRAFSDDSFDYDLTTSKSKKDAQEYILDFYKKSSLDENYELAYLEPFGDNLWEAVFAKKVDGLYNFYDSSKIFFCPTQRKIATLRVHSTEYHESKNLTSSSNVTEQEAKNIVANSFVGTDKIIINSAELTLTKPNNFFTRQSGSDIIAENIVVKAWRVEVVNEHIYSVFVDYTTGNIIGGDQIK